ncbi:sulfurtransferase [Actinotalea sp. JY-7885]|uniref:sulfurtransferase n=1 Tax=Actinotalea sp. JY-7885 TaxID=2758576 RepID=UPI00165EB679|nr:sulfurtransferase [Actinotalea sp. JY-7885]
MPQRAVIDTADLAAALAAPRPPLLLDVRWTLAGADPASYRAGHVPGAVFCDLDADLAAPPGEGGRHPLPTPADLERTLRRLGVAPDRDVVAYDGGPGAAAARAWWVLRWAGHERVAVLDGGLPAWVAAGGALEAGDVVPVATPDAVVRPGGLPTVTADDVLSGRAGTLVDARAAERYRGEVEPVDPVAGHIPGAVSVPTTALYDADGRLLPAEALAVALEPATHGPAAAYCGSGVTAAQVVLAADVAGLRLALYPGSWSHWVTDPSRPVATGAEPG